MPIPTLSAGQVLRLRLRAQGLAARVPARDKAADAVVRRVCGLQAQELPAALLGVRARSRGLTAAGVERARQEERAIVWTWAMRGTLHLLDAADAGWLVGLFGPRLVMADRTRRAQLGLTEDASIAAVRLILDMLAAQGPLTRDEIAERLRARGIRAEGQARAHLLYRAALEGTICRGPDRDGEPSYVLTRDWIGLQPALAREAALAMLARRYVDAYGPARPEDLAAWSGLGLADSRRAWRSIAAELLEVQCDDGPAWLPKRRAAWLRAAGGAAPQVSLLPRYDTYLLGYASRDLVLAPEYARRIHPGGGVLHAALLVDGRVRGTWRTQRRGKRLEVAIAPFGAELSAVERAGVEREVEDVGRFLEVETALAG